MQLEQGIYHRQSSLLVVKTICDYEGYKFFPLHWIENRCKWCPFNAFFDLFENYIFLYRLR